MTYTKHFLDLSKISSSNLSLIMEIAKKRKNPLANDLEEKPLSGKVLAMIFEKPSTRTRVSFEVAMKNLGGETIFLSGSEMQLGRAETIGDTARVLSRYVDAIVMRTTNHSRLLELAEHATVPVINALTDNTHPCQIIADVMTFEEYRESVKGKLFSWSGDGNNILNSLIEGAVRFDYRLNIATPIGSEPQGEYLNWARNQGASVVLFHDAVKAVKDSHCVFTDTWTSMNQEFRAREEYVFEPFQVNSKLMSVAHPDALFMHCLPAHRGKEVTNEVLDGPQSVVFDEAENRLHTQKAILLWCFDLA
ncbi:ornithine carbamoyltransferase [Candidatus Liberibacter solanacearum]|uniref:Ornithine carbamoyltransferase n=1 Tax=Candidatus Liberibacter solanacearum TaxID=556287 RepID=A0A095BF66_9HYPH|nr:ornithine carbamoyltransferase [Candidatus Liberibacter solanacearum]KGB27463.1 ornithine carbamoyltransferase [Candidatus Liberibacter solanacearum]KJZ81058.1 ornithine carbamoyltransferase [Candidatus Liberibacter solanacearum]KJZ82244.1 Ornithine carbamoyltransferase [Candidatus Liberibacter solanacearum]KQC49340.1 ornithine carbamoyltransferase [Candidatus Liberibacter solanacearum]